MRYSGASLPIRTRVEFIGTVTLLAVEYATPPLTRLTEMDSLFTPVILDADKLTIFNRVLLATPLTTMSELLVVKLATAVLPVSVVRFRMFGLLIIY
jgi:hypothetical protein